MSCLIFFILTHIWGIDILFEKLYTTSKTRGDEFEKHSFCTNMPVGRDFMESQWPGSKWIDKGCCLVIICGTWRSKKGFLNLSYREGEKPQTRGTFMGHHKKTTQGVDHWTTLSGITNYFSFLWCKKIYALHKISSY